MPMAVTVANANPYVGTLRLDALSGVYPGLGGGEFTAVTMSGPSYLSYYNSAATHADGSYTGFETFCVETGVEFTPGSTYYYTLGLVTQPLSGGGSGSDKALTLGAAWLYYEFATGNLANFNYGYGSARKADDNLLQAAIWALQGGQTYSGYPSLSSTEANNKFFLAALSAVGGSANAEAAYSGTTVQVLQLWANSNDTGAVQNQLVLTGTTPPVPHPLPDGGTTLLFLGSALAGLRALRCKLA